MVEAGIPCSVWHLTPRGARFVFILDRPAEGFDEATRATLGCASLVNDALIEAGLAARLDAKGSPMGGYLADSKALDAAHFMWAPRAIVDGVVRDAEVWSGESEPFPLEGLIDYVPSAAPKKERAPVTKRERAAYVAPDASQGVAGVLAKMDCEGGNDGSGALIKVCRRAIALGCVTEESFLVAIAEWNSRRGEPWEESDLLRRYRDAIKKWTDEGRELVSGRAHVSAQDASGRPILSFVSLQEILTNDTLFTDEGVPLLWYNTLKKQAMFGEEYIDDAAVNEIHTQIEQRYLPGATIAVDTLNRAIDTVARRQSKNPVADWILSLPDWDGLERIATMPEVVFGLTEDLEVYRAYLRKWMIGGVARALDPGCQVDSVLLLVGEQEAGKGTFFRAMGVRPDWVTSSNLDLDYGLKDAIAIAGSHWIVEIAEIDKIYANRGTPAKLKDFLTQQRDTYRAPFDRRIATHTRMWLCGASSNVEPLRDQTGSRRFWTIDIPGAVNHLWVSANIKQLWAEARTYFIDGLGKYPPVWCLSPEENKAREALNADMTADLEWEKEVVSYLQKLKFPNEVASSTIIKGVCPFASNGQGAPRSLQINLVLIMRNHGYRKKKGKNGNYYAKK